jgi:hypothetical protein
MYVDVYFREYYAVSALAKPTNHVAATALGHAWIRTAIMYVFRS